jgi:hypothetical protein
MGDAISLGAFREEIEFPDREILSVYWIRSACMEVVLHPPGFVDLNFQFLEEM